MIKSFESYPNRVELHPLKVIFVASGIPALKWDHFRRQQQAEEFFDKVVQKLTQKEPGI